MTKRGMRRLALLAMLLVIGTTTVTIAFFVRGSIQAKRVAEAREQGLQLYEAGDLEAALPYLGVVVGKVKNDPEVLIAYAECRRIVPMPNRSHIQRAIAAAKAAVELEPENVESLQVLLNLYGDAGYITEIVEVSTEMIDRDPTLYTPRLQRIEALRFLGRTQDALTDADELVAAFPERLETHMLRAYIATLDDSPVEEIVSVARPHLPTFAENPIFYAWLSKLERYAGNFDESIELARAAAEFPPVSAEQIFDLVELLRALHKISADTGALDSQIASSEQSLLDLADELFSTAMNDPDFGTAVACQATRRGWWANASDQSLEFASRIDLQGAVENVDAEKQVTPTWWAAIAIMSERVDESDPVVQRFVLADYLPAVKDTPWHEILLAMEALRSGDNEAVSRLLQDIGDGNMEAWAVAEYLKGVALHRMGESRGAIFALRNASETEGIPRDRAWEALGDAYTATGQFDEARSAYREISNSQTLRGLDRIDTALNGVETNQSTLLAKQVLDLLITRSETIDDVEPTFLVRLARAYILAGEPESGIRITKELIDSGVIPDPLGTLGLISTLRTYAPALGEDLLATMAEQTDNVVLLASQANAFAQSGDLDRGRELLSEQISKRTGAAALPYRRALLLVLDAHNAEDATEAARQLSDDYVESATAQLAALNTIAIWQDKEGARLAILRLREALGDRSTSWRTFDARATLDDNPSDEDISRVVLGLAEVINQSPDDHDALMLTARAYRLLVQRRLEENPDAAVSEFVDLASSYYTRAEPRGEGGIRTAAFKPHIDMLRSIGRDTDANRVLDRFVSIDFSPFDSAKSLSVVDLQNRLELLVEAGRWSEAALDQAWLASFENPQSVFNLAQLHERANDSAAAADLINQLIERGPLSELHRSICAEILADAGYIERAIEVFEGLPEESEIGNRDELIVTMLSRIGRPAEALNAQLKIARSRDGLEDWLKAIRIAGAMGDPSVAETTINEANLAHPNAPEILAFLDKNPLRQISLAVAATLDTNAGDAQQALRQLAIQHGRGEMSDEALLTNLTGFIEMHPELFEASRYQVRALFAQGDTIAAIRAAQQAADAMPDSPAAVRQAVEALRSAGLLDDAKPLAEKLVQLTKPDSFEAEIILAVIETDRRDYQSAINLLTRYRDRLERESRDNPTPGLISMAVAYAGIGNPAEAESLFLDRAREGGLGWQRIALFAAFAVPNNEVAIRRKWLNLATASPLAGPRANGFVQLARFSGERSDADAAMALFESDGDRKNPDWLWIAALSAKYGGDMVAAESLHRELIELAPMQFGVAASLADLLARQKDRATDALVLIESVRSAMVDQDPSTSILEELAQAEARAHAASDQLDAAYDALNPLVLEGDADPTSVVLLAKICLLRGNQERATRLVESLPPSGGLDFQTRTELLAVLAGL